MIIRMAARNIRRHLRRTIITTTGIALGTALTLFSVGLGDGGHNQMIENGVRLGHGHLTIQRVGYLESPSTSLYITEPEALLSVLEDQPGIRGVFPRVRGEGILSTAAGAEGIVFQGIKPDISGEGQLYRTSIVDGTFLKDSKSNSIVIGQKLATRLKLKKGKKAVLTCQDSNGDITSILVRVKGIFKTGSSSIDGLISLIPIDTARK
ncbi:MAG: ABC transporter permease, partial [bacterium]